MAPVKDPREVPKRIPSKRFSGIAAQLTGINEAFFLGLWLWMDWANNSLPVPVSLVEEYHLSVFKPNPLSDIVREIPFHHCCS